jgi:hypothetical protein
MLDGYLTRKEVQHQTGWSLNFIDKLPRTKIGGKVFIRADALREMLLAVSNATPPNPRSLAWEAMRLWDVNERRPLSDDKADLLTSTVSGFLLEYPGGDVRSDDFVRYAATNLPAGGGVIGNELRADILREAGLRRLL